MPAKLTLLILLLTSSFTIQLVVAEGTGDESGESMPPSFVVELSNFLIYNVSRESKPDDNQTYESWLAAVVNRILFESGVRGVLLGKRILNMLKKKISSQVSAMKIANRKGGSPANRLLNSWKNSTYRCTIYYNEMEVIDLQNQNAELKGEKRSLEHALQLESAKRMKVEEQLTVLKETVVKNETAYKGKFKQLVKKIARLKASRRVRGPAKNRSFKDYSKQHQSRIRKQIKSQCETALSFLGQYEFVPSRVELYNIATGEVESFSFDEDRDASGNEEEKQLCEDELHDFNTWLYLKDRFNISNEAWRELSLKSEGPPCLNKIIQHMNELNSKWNLRQTPGDADGIQVSFCESISEHVCRLRTAGVLKPGDTVKVKVSGDGTNIGKRLSVINITYTILNEKDLAMGEKGNYLLAVIKGKESYDTLSSSLSDLIKEMEQMKQVNVDDDTYDLEYYLGGDWKFLACVCGIGAANADYACIWCLCPKLKRYDLQKLWSVLDPESGARTIEGIKKCARSGKFNCNHAPLFPFIPLSHVIIDTLHLYLRICDNLINLLIKELKVCDAIDKKKVFSDNFPRDRYKHMAGYEKYLQSLGIPFQFYISKETKNLDYRDLTGPEKVKLFKNIKISSLLPNSPKSNIHNIQQIWDDFTVIMADLKQDFKYDEVSIFKTKVENWLAKFLGQYQTKDVTPYMHALYCHVPEFLSLYGNIEHLNQQGMEKYYDITPKNFFRSTNHKGISAIKQLFLKKNRVQYLESVGCARINRKYTCSNCNDNGHTIKTCTTECSSCGYATYCAHLIKVAGKYQPSCSINI